MNKYPPSRPGNKAEVKDARMFPDLEFPVDQAFLSLPPRIEPQVMLRRLEETMPWRSSRPGEEERRLKAKVDVEFVL